MPEVLANFGKASSAYEALEAIDEYSNLKAPLCILSRKWKSGLRTLRILLPAGDGKLLRSSQTLELLHVDLIGPIRVMYISHQRYVLVVKMIILVVSRLYSHSKNEDKIKRKDMAKKHIRKVLKGRKIKRVDGHVLKEMVKRRLQFASDDIILYYVYLEMLEKKTLAIEESLKKGDKFGWKRLEKVFRNIMPLN
ncbi:hypothetical protein MP228_000272 [Amoeboaphelidium protococcarum]|nr:hypothetical protein MP228_000272 [Amoeboaphelidium protococcarum]